MYKLCQIDKQKDKWMSGMAIEYFNNDNQYNLC